jgi:hypothetical protein
MLPPSNFGRGTQDATFEAELVGVPRHGLAVALHVLIESDASPGLGQDHLKRGCQGVS